MVSVVRQNSERSSASAQIARATTTRSATHRATSQQPLEETVASMEELGSTVRQNADNARKPPTSWGHERSTVAAQGGVEGVRSGRDHERWSTPAANKTADIVGGSTHSLDQLALNASSWKPPGAGEQGRGFAVVAGEVQLVVMQPKPPRKSRFNCKWSERFGSAQTRSRP